MNPEEFLSYYYRYKEVKRELRVIQTELAQLEQIDENIDKIKRYRSSESTALQLLNQLETKKSK